MFKLHKLHHIQSNDVFYAFFLHWGKGLAVVLFRTLKTMPSLCPCWRIFGEIRNLMPNGILGRRIIKLFIRSHVIIHFIHLCTTKNYNKTQECGYHYTNSRVVKTNEVIAYQVWSSTHPKKAMSRFNKNI